MDWTAVSAIVNMAFVIVTVGVLLVNRQQVNASKQQADASQDQVFIMQKQVEAGLEQLRISREQLRQSQEQMNEQLRIAEQQLMESQQQVRGTLEAAQRPFVYPYTAPALKHDGDNTCFDFDQLDPNPDDPETDTKKDTIEFRNAGTGTALNIAGIMMQPRPEDEEGLRLAPRCRMAGLSVLATRNSQGSYHVARNFGLGWDSIVGNDRSNTFAAPPRKEAFSPVLRLTLVYYDIFGQRYASQFDLYPSSQWNFRWFGKMDSNSELYERLYANSPSRFAASARGRSPRLFRRRH